MKYLRFCSLLIAMLVLLLLPSINSFADNLVPTGLAERALNEPVNLLALGAGLIVFASLIREMCAKTKTMP